MIFIFFTLPVDTIIEYFTLIQSNPLIGLISLDFLYVVDQVLIIPIILSLYITLKRINKSVVTLSAILALIGIIIIFASNTSITMLNLSSKYAIATTPEEQAMYLAMGEVLLAINSGTGYHLHIFLGSVGVTGLSIIMLKDKTYGKSIAILGILANLLTLAYYIPVIGLYLLTGSLLFFEIWVIMLGVKFIRLN
jgi:hypothetical protein